MAENCKPRIYTVATTHLDTSWSWELETTLNEYLPKTLTDNFALFEKYPDYVFSFEGSYRYELMREYYPALFEKLKEYVTQGRWHVAGSAYESGDVNIPSPEALFRNFLYGTQYFEDTFGKRSEDIYLPDCFGFGYALPSVAAHANIKGFTTQKLCWSSAYGLPFDLGVWKGPDGNAMYACVDAHDYNATLKKVRRKGAVARKLAANIRQYDLPMTVILHGIGDRGGAPREESVQTVIREASQNASERSEVVLASTDRVFRDMDTLLTPRQKQRLPVWDNELVMTDHGVGCYTSRTASKRFNRRCEQLADAAERAAVAALLTAGSEYPQQVLDTAWKSVIAHQFHDDLTGTSLETCYERNWNDYIMALNRFAEEYRAAAAAVGAQMDTAFAQGTAVLVNNPLQSRGKRGGTVSVDICTDKPCARVYGPDGAEVPSNSYNSGNGQLRVVFTAAVEANGWAVYDVHGAESPCPLSTGLSVSERRLENRQYLVELDDNGDIARVFDKILQKDLLAAPIRMALFDYDGKGTYPAWELGYKEVMAPAREYAAAPTFRVLENGPARVSVQTVRTARGSVFTQTVTLTDGGDTVEVFNEVDWRSLRTLLKTPFELAVADSVATYDLGLGVIRRGNNRPRLYEVPAQMWADISEERQGYGVSVFSDSRCGWDKPRDNVLRLTGIHTPRGAYRDAQHMLDFGINRYGFGLFSHAGDWRNGTQAAAARFHAPLHAFLVSSSPGPLGREFSLCAVSDDTVRLRALKKAQRGEELIVRVNESEGLPKQGVRLRVSGGIVAAREVYATEEPKGPAEVVNGELVFDIGAFEPKTFALTVCGCPETADKTQAVPLALPYNLDAVSFQNTPGDGALPNGVSIPGELLPKRLLCGGVRFVTGDTADAQPNAVVCVGQHIPLPNGARTLYVIAAAFGGDRDVVFGFDDARVTVRVPDGDEPVGTWDLANLNRAGYIKKDPLAWYATHAHNAQGDIRGRQIRFFKLTVSVPENTGVWELPKEDAVVILAASVGFDHAGAEAGALYDSLEKRDIDYTLTSEEDFAAHHNKAGRRRARRQFLLGYARRRLRREWDQVFRRR